MNKKYFFCGIGGSGMSSLAYVVKSMGYDVSGSDRSYDQGKFPDKFEVIKKSGINLCAQDGFGVTDNIDYLVVSAAIEPAIPDVKSAIDKNIAIINRADLLSELFNNAFGIAIGGTSGKSTVTAMIAHILKKHLNPTVINGAVMIGNESDDNLGNSIFGTGKEFVIEACESDGSIALYDSQIAILNNITLDHKPIAELIPLFSDFVKKAKTGAVVNIDDEESKKLKNINKNTITFSIDDTKANIFIKDIKPMNNGYDLVVCFDNIESFFHLPQYGRHNISNALAAISTAILSGVDASVAIESLNDFKGVQSRLQLVSQVGGVTIIDDFAHNPDKIDASLQALHESHGKLIIMFQLHGYGPAHMLKDGIIKSFSTGLADDDILYMPEIYYAGGTADKSISAKEFIDNISATGKKAKFLKTKDEIIEEIKKEMKSGDRIIIMGARDDDLRKIARSFI